jgi:hypothetical protein
MNVKTPEPKIAAKPAVPLFARKVNRAALTVRTSVRAGRDEMNRK